LIVHDTDFTTGDLDLSAPGALAAVHQALAVDEARNTAIADDVVAALSRGRNCLVLTWRVAMSRRSPRCWQHADITRSCFREQ
jgi:hypothetical protein